MVTADVIILDELDRSTKDNFLILSLYRYYTENYNYSSKLVILSNNEYKDLFPEDPTYVIKANMYSIEVKYHNKNYDIRDINTMTSDISDLIYRLHYSSLKGDILVFAIGEGQIKSILRKLREMNLSNVDLLSSDNIDKLYGNVSSKRRIIISSDLAETGITLNNIGAIVDPLIEARPDLSLTGGYRYPLCYVTQNKADIRARRGGITIPTTVYRMMTKSKYDNLSENLNDEIFRLPTHYTMLEIMKHGLDPFVILDMFPKKQLEYTYNLMIRLGIINFNNSITDMGEFVQTIPFGIRQASILWKYSRIEDKSIFPIILVLAMIDNFSTTSYYLYPEREEKVETRYQYNTRRLNHKDEYFMPFSGDDDVETYLNIWDQIISDISFTSTDEDLKKWCKDNSFNFYMLRDVKTLAQNVMHILTLKNGLGINTNKFNVDEVLNNEYYLYEVISNIYSDRIFKLNLDKQVVTNYLDSDDNNYSIDSENINNIREDKPLHIVALIVSRFNTNIGSYNVVSCASSLDQ